MSQALSVILGSSVKESTLLNVILGCFILAHSLIQVVLVETLAHEKIFYRVSLMHAQFIIEPTPDVSTANLAHCKVVWVSSNGISSILLAIILHLIYLPYFVKNSDIIQLTELGHIILLELLVHMVAIDWT